MQKFIAEPDYVAKVFLAVERANPNDPATEIWDDEAIQELANYLLANDFAEVDLDTEDTWYVMYDMLKWTLANRQQG